MSRDKEDSVTQETEARYRADLQGEIDSASLYRALAQAESDPRTSGIFSKLAAVEDAHAEFWRKNLKSIGATGPSLKPGWRTRMLALLARRFGPSFVLPTINVLEHPDSGGHDAQPESVAGRPPTPQRAAATSVDWLARKSR